ncbi:MAG TPA: TolC family protein [Gemmatimonadales bacterium]|nr:TolC family protein [Gemmatimonadales bacterium]
MRHPARLIAVVIGLAATMPAAAVAQDADTLRLGLADAVARARVHHPAVVQAVAERRARDGDVLAGAAAFAPRIDAEFGLLRSTDPVAVFGSRLRQGRFGAADLALGALNQPAPLTDVATTLSLQQPLFQPEALLARRAGRAAARAAALGASRTEQTAAFDAVRTYVAARLAEERVVVLREALDVARRTLAQVQSLRRNGTVTVVDEQLARARVSEVESGLAAAATARVAAGDLLLAVLGEPAGRPLRLDDPLTLPMPGADTSTAGRRDDVAALEAAVAAADANVSRARGAWVPSAGAFGVLDWHADRAGIAQGPSHWTAGVVIRWTPFRGLADVGQLRRAEAERDGARERLSDLRRVADAETRLARAERTAALASVATADAALAGAAEAARVAGVRYAEGVGTIIELLAVRAAESAQRLARLQALYQARVADAALVLSLGRLPE